MAKAMFKGGLFKGAEYKPGFWQGGGVSGKAIQPDITFFASDRPTGFIAKDRTVVFTVADRDLTLRSK
jgi:hypothetical protein